MNITAEHLYNLLPSIYRIRDAEQGGTLAALIALLAKQANIIEQDIAHLYDNWFIETCDEWTVPYIGDLLGVRNLYQIDGSDSVGGDLPFSRRARVANTLAYRRRKGTITMIEQPARDTTGLHARAVEFFTRLGWTQNVNHLREEGHRTVDLRDPDRLALLESPFDTIAHSVDVRSIADREGVYNIPNIGIFLWRLSGYAFRGVEARREGNSADACYRFNRLGIDTHLFNRPQTETDILHLAEEVNVPAPLRRLPLFRELEGLRSGRMEGDLFGHRYFGRSQSSGGTSEEHVFDVLVAMNPGDHLQSIPPEELLICNLDSWHTPPATREYTAEGSSTPESKKISAAVDPVLGRISFPSGVHPHRVEVHYSYGFSGDIGGGPYNREDSWNAILKDRKVDWQCGVSKEPPPEADPGTFVTTLAEAVARWNSRTDEHHHDENRTDGIFGVIVVTDNRIYEEDLTGNNSIRIREGDRLLIIAADWPREKREDGTWMNIPGRANPQGLAGHLLGNLSVKGVHPGSGDVKPGELFIDGMLIEGRVRVLAGNLGKLRISNSTIVPGIGNLLVSSGNEALRIELERSITGRIRLQSFVPELTIRESLVDGKDQEAIIAQTSALNIIRSTIFGGVEGLRIDADTTIFTGRTAPESPDAADKVIAVRRQIGCVRFCRLPEGSRVARRYQSQPDFALTSLARSRGLRSASALEAAERERIALHLHPRFTSTEYGEPGYGQLHTDCAEEIRRGGENGAEMGAFNSLLQPQREANLREALPDFLRFGLEAGILYVT